MVTATGLGAWALRESLAVSDLEVALTLGGVELPRGGGYRRWALSPGDWQWKGHAATATAAFGPFAKLVTFDGLVVYDGTEEVAVLPKPRLATVDLYEADVVLAMFDD